MTKRLLSTLVLALLIAPIGRAQATKLTPDEEKAAFEVMTTGERGIISVSTDGKDLKISRFQW
jgi:hypothetical protein